MKDASTNYLGNSLDFNNWFDNQLLVIYELFVKNNVQQLGKFKIDNTFWNQDITKVEIEIARILHEYGYRIKPDPVASFNFEAFLVKKARLNITIEDYKETLL